LFGKILIATLMIMANRLFLIRKKIESVRDEMMMEMMIDSGGRETGERAVAQQVGGDNNEEKTVTREHRVTGKGPGGCVRGIGIGLLREEKPKDHYNNNSLISTQHDQNHGGVQQYEGREHTLRLIHQDALSPNLFAEENKDILLAALALHRAARGWTVMEETKGGAAAAATKKQGEGFIQNLGNTKVSQSISR
jgi:hypothetical protein